MTRQWKRCFVTRTTSRERSADERQKQQRQHKTEEHGAETAEERALRNIARNGGVGIGVILRDAQNAHQAGLRAAAARAEGIAPCDAAAQPKQKTEHRIRGMNEQAEQTIRLLVFAR